MSRRRGGCASNTDSQILTSIAQLPGSLSAGAEEGYLLPFRVPRRLVQLAESLGTGGGEPGSRLARQFVPTADEHRILPYDEVDPLVESRYTPTPRLIHRYANRVLVLMTGRCFMYCRHCFRRYYAGRPESPPSENETQAIADYIAAHIEVDEVLLSGGDPATLSDENLRRFIRTLAEACRPRPMPPTIRLSTRAPTVLPGRVTTDWVSILRSFRIWLVLHVNDVSEFDAEADQAIDRVRDGGVPIVAQTVLLRGINDDPAVLAKLLNAMIARGIKPMYLFQGDLAAGTAHMRVSLSRALSIVGEVRRRVSGLAMPRFAVDLPGGGGKAILDPDVAPSREGGGFRIAAPDGSFGVYPDESDGVPLCGLPPCEHPHCDHPHR